MTAARVPTPNDPASPACTRVGRIVICDDQPELREAIIQVLARNPHFAVVGQAYDGVSCVEQVEQTRPDLLILDVNMPGGGPRLAAAAKLIRPQLHIVVFSGRQDSAITTAMLEAGADQYIVKTGRVRPLVQALETAYGALAMDE